MTADVIATRSEWEQGYVRFREETRDPIANERLHAQMAVLTAELQRRVGGTFTIRELVNAYAESDHWAREAVADRMPTPGWVRTISLVGAAAFHLYARGALDYKP